MHAHADDTVRGAGGANGGDSALAERMRERLVAFAGPLLRQLDARLDRRLVRTLSSLLEAIVRLRHRSYGLLLSELGAYLLDPEHAPAGTKRLSNLLRCAKWSSGLVSEYLKERAVACQHQLQEEGEQAVLVWDQSVLEKPESLKSEGLCAVRSSKAARLKRIKPGYYNPPGGPPIFVPGIEWVALLLTGVASRAAPHPPVVGAMRWWSKTGKHAADLRGVQLDLLAWALKGFGRAVWHVFDRGYAGTIWLGALLASSVPFIVRWPHRYMLIDAQDGPANKGKTNAWRIGAGKRAWDQRWWRNTHTGRMYPVSVLAVPVHHPDFQTPLWLVLARQGKGKPPWYLLTNQPVSTPEQAWRIVSAYARRWQIEMAFRYSKSELAMESPRLCSWEGRLKLLMIVTVVYAFLLSLLEPCFEWLRQALLRHFCHRTGKRSRQATAPLYRIREALSHLWNAFPELPSYRWAQTPG